MCVSPLAGPSASKTSCGRRNCTHLLVSALEVTNRCWTSLVWRSTPTTSSTCSASGKIQRPKKYYDSLADVAGGVIHPFYEGMKKKMNRADRKLWGISPLPDNLITYAGTDAYATYKSWKTIDDIVTGWDSSKEQEADPYYHCNFADEDA